MTRYTFVWRCVDRSMCERSRVCSQLVCMSFDWNTAIYMYLERSMQRKHVHNVVPCSLLFICVSVGGSVIHFNTETTCFVFCWVCIHVLFYFRSIWNNLWDTCCLLTCAFHLVLFCLSIGSPLIQILCFQE